MKYIGTAVTIGILIFFCAPSSGESSGSLKYGELRVGAHAAFITPITSDFKREVGYGGIIKYKFTETLGIEVGVDYFRWQFDGDIVMPFPEAPGPVSFKEVNRVYPIYFTALLYSPVVVESARGYLGLGGGYYEIDSDIGGHYNVDIDGVTYPFTITGRVSGQWSAHAAVGADFQLSDHIFLNVEAKYVLTDIDRQQTHSNPDAGAVTIKDETGFNNWQIRAGLQYSF